ncbi:carbohydrate sulfotransferase 5-like [Penaeus chinensis]|uniref:carbohydrate sulfotransferase 5-like n=1 Tax=Penaeus chinensis TaxID=139456 RepID=UPI001FB5B4AB|nr:carbohydrate sulfotransferase 5-like [Penaeus chinensis]
MRSGSSFAGDLLTASPHTFYTEEPLRGSKLSGRAESVAFLKDILQCRFRERPRFLEKWMYGANTNDYRTKLLCTVVRGVCEDASLVEAMCQAARAKVTRVVSREMGAAAALLEEGGLSVRVIHLVRDPRALLASRARFRNGSHGKYVLGAGIGFRQEEKDPSAVCARYRQDVAARASLLRLHPDRYVLVRYEDLALDADGVLRRLYPFMGLPYTATAACRVAFHTLGLGGASSDHPFSTVKNSTSTVFSWRRHLPFRDMARIQKECGDVLEAYGYRSFRTQKEYENMRVSPLYLSEEEVTR